MIAGNTRATMTTTRLLSRADSLMRVQRVVFSSAIMIERNHGPHRVDEGRENVNGTGSTAARYLIRITRLGDNCPTRVGMDYGVARADRETGPRFSAVT